MRDQGSTIVSRVAMVSHSSTQRAFFLFIRYVLACDLSDHGKIMYSPFSVCCPRGGGTLQAPLLKRTKGNT